MKRILCALLCVSLLFCLSACKDKKDDANNTVGDKVNQNTVSLVNIAYDDTEELVESLETLGYEITYRRNLTYGEESDALGISITYDFIGKGEGRKFFYETDVKGNDDAYIMMYSDGENIYGYKADTTYLLVNDNLTNAYIDEFSDNVTIFNASDFDVIDTVIMDTSLGGHAFILTYDVKSADFDPAEVFGPLYAEAATDYELKPTSLKVSGIINSDGRITEQTVSYEYTYQYEDMSDVDPDNEDASGVMKNATVRLEAAIMLNFDLDNISAPADIDLLPEDESEQTDIKELSLTDFLKIGQQSAENK